MRYGWLIVVAVAIICAGAALGYWWAAPRKGAKERPGWIANSGYIRLLPAFKDRVRRVRVALVMGLIGVIVGAIALSALAGQPVKRRVVAEQLGKRDIVLCLDASISMITVDGRVLDSYAELLKGFSGERVALVIWNQISYTLVPLTNDYEVLTQTLKETAETIRNGVIYSGNKPVGLTPKLNSLLEPTILVNRVDRNSSLAGDGLVNCAMAFDNRDKERSRSIILATDNEVVGTPVYTLGQALDVTGKRKIKVFGLFAKHPESTAGDDPREEFKTEVEKHGGKFYNIENRGAISGIIEAISQTQINDLKVDSKVIENDVPDGYIPLILIAFGLLVVARFWGRV